MDSHLRLLRPGAAVVYNRDTIKPCVAVEGILLGELNARSCTSRFVLITSGLIVGY